MGWIILLILVLAAFGLLWKLGRMNGAPLQFVLAGLFLAIAGYAWQGRPTLHGAIAAPPVEESEAGTEAFAQLRREILGQFDQASSWLTLSESYARKGDTQSAVGILQSALRRHPHDADLWIGLGNALVRHGQGQMTAAAELAFGRAQAYAGANPAPRFFYGLALAEGGRFAEAEAQWRRVVAELPAGVSWRPLVVDRLDVLRQIRAVNEGRPLPVQ